MTGSPVPVSWALLHVVPHPHTGQGAPVGVVLQSRPAEFLGLRCVHDPEDLRALAPDADLELLARYLRVFQGIVRGDADAGPIALLSRPERFHWLTAPRSDVLQPSAVTHGMAEDPEALLVQLFGERITGG